MRVFHMHVEEHDLFLILCGDETTTAMVAPDGFESWSLAPDPADTVLATVLKNPGRLIEVA